LEELKHEHSAYLREARKKVMERFAESSQGKKNEPTEEELKQLVEEDEEEILKKLTSKRQRVVQKLDEKIAIASQSYDIIDHHIRRLDQDLEAYAELLKHNGEFEDDKATKKKKKLQQQQLQLQQQIQQQQQALTPVLKKQSTSTTGNGSTTSGRKRSAVEAQLEVVSVVPGGIITEELPVDPNEPLYCFCRRVSYGNMVGCDNDDCKYEWFHFDCVGLSEQPQGKWYCKECKATMGK
jgi:hypothetical protein